MRAIATQSSSERRLWPTCEPEIPERVEELLGHPLHVRARSSPSYTTMRSMSDERVQLAAAVAAEGGHHEGVGGQAAPVGVVGDEPGEGGDDVVHESGVRAHRFLPRRALGVHRP